MTVEPMVNVLMVYKMMHNMARPRQRTKLVAFCFANNCHKAYKDQLATELQLHGYAQCPYIYSDSQKAEVHSQ